MKTETFEALSTEDLLSAHGGRNRGTHIDMHSLSAAERFIINHESGGWTGAKNPTSSAFGLGQLLKANRKHYMGANWQSTDPGLQLKAFRAYVHDRYGNANRAMSFWKSHHWY